jgi:hypothetical protein
MASHRRSSGGIAGCLRGSVKIAIERAGIVW